MGVFRIEGSGPETPLAAVAGSPCPSGGAFTSVLTFIQNRTFLLAANDSTGNVTSYAVDRATGALSGVSIQPPVGGQHGNYYRHGLRPGLQLPLPAAH